MIREKNILKNYILYFLCFLSVIVVGVSRPQAVAITDYATKYYYYSANDNSSTTSTDYRSGSSNRVTLDGATAPTYANGEGFNGFYNRVNYTLTKGSIYTLSLNVNYNSVLPSEFSQNTINNRLLNTDFAHCSACTITAVSGNIREYNSTNQAVSGAKDYVVHMSYTFVATSSVSQFYIGSYTGDDRTLGLDNHQTTVIVIVASLDISNDNSSTIINQNDTIINQNNQIIEQNNQNTQDIIDANNQNAQDIINNQNQNNQNMIDSQKVCNDYSINSSSIITRGYYLNDSGVSTSVTGSTSFGVTDYYSINSNSIIKLLNKESSNVGGRRACFYDSNKNNISCIQPKDFSINDTITIPQNAKFIRFTIDYSLNLPIWSVSTCKHGNQALDDSINGLNDSLNDDDTTGAESEASEFFGSFNTETFGLTSIITAPLNLIRSVLSSTCTTLQLPLPYLDNKKLDLPCMSSIYSQYFGSFFTIYQTITYGIIAYWVCVRIFNQVKDFKNPEHDEIEVMDL